MCYYGSNNCGLLVINPISPPQRSIGHHLDLTSTITNIITKITWPFTIFYFLCLGNSCVKHYLYLVIKIGWYPYPMPNHEWCQSKPMLIATINTCGKSRSLSLRVSYWIICIGFWKVITQAHACPMMLAHNLKNPLTP